MKEHTKKSRLEVPKSSSGDHVHAIVRAALGAIPFGGQAAIEAFTSFVNPPLTKRQQEWMEDVSNRLNRLSEVRQVNLDELQNNDVFMDLLLSANRVAILNSQEEKKEALRNAIENAAVGDGLDEALQHMFIHWIDELSVWHLRLLKFFRNPKEWAERHGISFPSYYASSASQLLEVAFPELKERRNFYDQVWRDLHQRGLVSVDSLHTLVSGQGLYNNQSSEMGMQFLEFIGRDEERKDP